MFVHVCSCLRLYNSHIMEDNREHIFDTFSSLQLFAVVVDVSDECLQGEDEKHFKGMFGLFKLTELTEFPKNAV